MSKNGKITESKIKAELINQISHKEFENISVRDITKNIGIDRSTFYLHYNNITDVFQDIESNIMQDAQKIIMKNKSDFFTMLKIIMDYVQVNKKIFNILLNKHNKVFISEFSVLLKEIFLLTPSKYTIKDVEQSQNYAIFFISGCLGLISDWVKNDCQTEICKICHCIHSIILN